MEEELRKSGIEAVGDIPWGTHFCTFYETQQDLLDILVPFFKTGLENREFCLWIISNSELLTIEEAADALRKALPDLDRHLSEGNIELINHDGWFLEDGSFDLRRVAHRFKQKLDSAVAKGYVGMRVNGSPAWLYKDNDEELVAFEQALDKLLPDLRVIASCTYPIRSSEAGALLDVAHAHRFAITRRHGNWEVLEAPELIRARSELAKLNEELERRVIERTRELSAANEALRREIAERERAQLESRMLIDAIPQQIWSGPPDGTNDYVNERWRAETGISQEEVRGDGWETLVHPDDRDRVLKAWQYSVLNGTPYEQEERHRRADGSYRWYLNRAVALRDNEGHIIRWYGTSTDIEDRKQAEQALRRSENELRLVIDTIPVMAWTVRPDGVVDFLNRQSLECAGLSFEEYVADPTRPIHPEDVSRVMEKWPARMARGETYEDEMRLRSVNGEYRWFLVRTAPLRDQGGTIVKWYGVSTDIEDRKRAEEELRESQQLLKLVLATLPVGVAVTDQSGDIILVNSASKRIWGGDTIVSGRQRWKQSKGVWHDSGKSIAPTDWASVRALSKGQTSLNELIDIETYDGRQKIMENSAAPIRSTDGRIVGSVIVNEDVTERVRTTEQLRTTTEQLRALSDRLQLAKEEEATRIARELHDELGSTLTSLKWDLELLETNVLELAQNALQSKLRKRITDIAAQIDTTIQSVRRISSELRPAILDDLGLIAAVQSYLVEFQERSGISTRFRPYVDDIVLTPSQSTALFRIFQEALTNILRHARATQIEVTIRQHDGEFVLAISDNGHGITESAKTSSQSLGLLGMEERARLIGGEIEIAERSEGGTMIRVRVPVTRNDADANEEAESRL